MGSFINTALSLSQAARFLNKNAVQASASPIASQLASSTGGYQPQTQNNWRIELYPLNQLGLDPNILILSLATGFLPTRLHQAVEIANGNERIFLATRGLFDSGTITFRDYLDKDLIGVVEKWASLIYNPLTGAIGLPSQYKLTANLILLPPFGDSSPSASIQSQSGYAPRIFELAGFWPETINYGSLDMSTANQVMVTISFRFDKAIYTGKYTSVAQLPLGG
jgi:hypothetical protein